MADRARDPGRPGGHLRSTMPACWRRTQQSLEGDQRPLSHQPEPGRFARPGPAHEGCCRTAAQGFRLLPCPGTQVGSRRPGPGGRARQRCTGRPDARGTGYCLPTGMGIIGHVADTGEAFTTNAVDQVLFFVRNPLLPETQSEMCGPDQDRGTGARSAGHPADLSPSA